MKHHHPDVFCASLMNAQPMGFYAPLRSCATREHGVEVRPPCVNASRWDCTLEPTGSRYLAVRLGLSDPRFVQRRWGQDRRSSGNRLVRQRGGRLAPIGAQRASIEKLADGDAFHAFGADRRQGLWKVRGLGKRAAAPLRGRRSCGCCRQRRGYRACGSAAPTHRRARGHRGLSQSATVASRTSPKLRARRAVPTRRALLCRPEHHP
jgi:DNA polymerase III alpha subunit